MNHVEFAITVAGLTYTITRSKIGEPIRRLLSKIRLEYFSTCSFCVGFSIGIVVRLSQMQTLVGLDIPSLVRHGFMGSFYGFVGALFLDILSAIHQFIIIQNERFTQAEEE